MSPASRLSRAIEAACDTAALIAGLLLLVVVVLTVANVTGFALDRVTQSAGVRVRGLPGYEDAVAMLVGSAATLMLPLCQLKRGHVAVDTVVALAPLAVRRAILQLCDVLFACVAGLLALALVYGALDAATFGTLTPVLGWQVWPFFVPAIIGCALWSFTAAAMAAGLISTGALDDRA
ncbi:MAG: TRAP transporter small permease [Hyphomicrobiaceae bacterium]